MTVESTADRIRAMAIAAHRGDTGPAFAARSPAVWRWLIRLSTVLRLGRLDKPAPEEDIREGELSCATPVQAHRFNLDSTLLKGGHSFGHGGGDRKLFQLTRAVRNLSMILRHPPKLFSV